METRRLQPTYPGLNLGKASSMENSIGARDLQRADPFFRYQQSCGVRVPGSLGGCATKELRLDLAVALIGRHQHAAR